MILKLRLSLCLNNSCNQITFTDTTGLYNSTTATQAWSNTQVVGNLTTTDLLSGRITMTLAGDTTPTYTFYTKTTSGVDLYPAEATDSFEFTPFTWVGDDGVYTVSYSGTVDSPDSVTTYTYKTLIHCQADACIKNLWASYWVSGNQQTKDKAMEAEALLNGAIYAFICNENTNATSIVEVLTKICAMADADDCCGCGC